jgi:hypothetical protein
MPIPNDTSPEAERVLREVYRTMPLARRWGLLGEMYSDARWLHAAGCRLRMPGATPEEFQRDWVRLLVEPSLREEFTSRPMQGLHDHLAVVGRVAGVFTSLGIPYALGGALACSLFGKPRFPHDAEAHVEPFPGFEPLLCSAFPPEFVLRREEVLAAVSGRTAFMLGHAPTAFKVDVVIRRARPFSQSFMRRRQFSFVPGIPDRPLAFLSCEDLILSELEDHHVWGEGSNQVWLDVLGVLAIQGPLLDPGYLGHWAATLGLSDLLARAVLESEG